MGKAQSFKGDQQSQFLGDTCDFQKQGSFLINSSLIMHQTLYLSNKLTVAFEINDHQKKIKAFLENKSLISREYIKKLLISPIPNVKNRTTWGIDQQNLEKQIYFWQIESTGLQSILLKQRLHYQINKLLHQDVLFKNILSQAQCAFQLPLLLLIIFLTYMILAFKYSPILSLPRNTLVSLFCTTSYESRKQAKRLQMQNYIFNPSSQSLIQKQLNAQFLVPNFFTNKIAVRKFPFVNLGSKAVNSFLNSYNCMYLPLSTNIKLRQKLNKIIDNQVRTGRIFEIMDSVAGLVSYEHCYGTIDGNQKNSMICVTGSIESFYMFERIDIKKDLQIKGYLNAVGKTSMEIEIYLQQEGKVKANSIFTMIARNSDNPLKGYPVPTLDFSSLNQLQRNKAFKRQAIAKENANKRKVEIQNSYDKKPPTPEEVAQLHKIFLQRKGYLTSTQNSTPIESTIIENSQIMHTQQRNVHGKIFGGFLIRQMVEIGWVAACKYSEDYVIVEDLTNIYFKKPVDIGCRLTLRSRVTYVENTRLVLTVQAFTAKFTEKKQTLACTLNFIARSAKSLRGVHPQSYEEGLLYLSSKKAFCELFY